MLDLTDLAMIRTIAGTLESFGMDAERTLTSVICLSLAAGGWLSTKWAFFGVRKLAGLGVKGMKAAYRWSKPAPGEMCALILAAMEQPKITTSTSRGNLRCDEVSLSLCNGVPVQVAIGEDAWEVTDLLTATEKRTIGKKAVAILDTMERDDREARRDIARDILAMRANTPSNTAGA